MKSSSTQCLTKQSGESNLVPRPKGMSTAIKREREDIDSKNASPVRGDGEDSRKQYSQETNENSAQAIMKQQLNVKVNQLICKNDHRPLTALWEALNDTTTPGIELPMAIIMDLRCGIERRAKRDDNLVEGSRLDDSASFIMAVHAHRNDVVEALLADGADPSARDIDGRSAFLLAATYGNVTAMDLLVRYGADPFAVSRDKYRYSALHLAALNGRAQAVQWLVELGASTEAVDDNGNTPLRLSTCRADLPSIVALLDNGSNVEAVGQYGMTPLHWASLCGNIGAVETLVLERAIITAKDKWGCTPLVMYGKYCPRRIGGAEIAAATALLTPTSQDLLKLSTVQCQQRK